MYRIFYKPDTSWAGDIIPYVEHGIFYLYYLNERRIHGIPAEKTTWDLVLTKDFFHFKKREPSFQRERKPMRTEAAIRVL